MSSVKLLFGLWPPCCATPPSPPSSCVRAHEQYNHEKINSWVSFSLYGYGAPLGERSSAIKVYLFYCRNLNSKIYMTLVYFLPSSHFSPSYSKAHWQVNKFLCWVHVPPFPHGFGRHRSISKRVTKINK